MSFFEARLLLFQPVLCLDQKLLACSPGPADAFEHFIRGALRMPSRPAFIQVPALDCAYRKKNTLTFSCDRACRVTK